MFFAIRFGLNTFPLGFSLAGFHSSICSFVSIPVPSFLRMLLPTVSLFLISLLILVFWKAIAHYFVFWSSLSVYRLVLEGAFPSKTLASFSDFHPLQKDVFHVITEIIGCNLPFLALSGLFLLHIPSYCCLLHLSYFLTIKKNIPSHIYILLYSIFI